MTYTSCYFISCTCFLHHDIHFLNYIVTYTCFLLFCIKTYTCFLHHDIHLLHHYMHVFLYIMAWTCFTSCHARVYLHLDIHLFNYHMIYTCFLHHDILFYILTYTCLFTSWHTRVCLRQNVHVFPYVMKYASSLFGKKGLTATLSYTDLFPLHKTQATCQWRWWRQQVPLKVETHVTWK